MSVHSISDLAHQQMLNILGFSSSGQATGQTANAAGSSSSFAQMLAQLQQLEQSNPTQYSKVSQQISSQLSTAASNAQKQGNTSLAANLNTLSKDFSDASQTGQLPNFSDLERAMQAARHSATQAQNSVTSALSTGSHSKGIDIMNQILSLASF